MSKSRFDNLELERPKEEGPAQPKVSRFDQAPERQPAPPQHGVPHDPIASIGTERFAASGDEGVALELADDSQPFRRCPGCKRDSTRYETRCKFCGTALDSAEARAFNDALWKQLQGEAELEKTAHAQHEAELQQAAMEQRDQLLAARKQIGRDLATKYSDRAPQDSVTTRWRVGLALGGAVLLATSYELQHFPVLRLVLGGAGLLAVMAALPGNIVLRFGSDSDRRRWF